MAARKPTYWITPGCQAVPEGHLVRLDPSGEAWVLQPSGEWDRRTELDRLASDADSMETSKTTLAEAQSRAARLGCPEAVRPGKT